MKEKLNNSLENFEKALLKLSELETYPYIDDVVRTGFLHRFNFTYELAIKTMRRYLISNGQDSEEIKGSKDIFRLALKVGIINDIDIWFNMLENRNILVHEYNFMKSNDIFEIVKNEYLKEFKKILKKLKN
jgi:nucleotidyltransferase substrate binding protein (TIGR01987 family)